MNNEPQISGIGNNVTQFSSGAVRDIQEDKGRCDLMPCYAISLVYRMYQEYKNRPLDSLDCWQATVFRLIDNYIYSGDMDLLSRAIVVATHYSGDWWDEGPTQHDALGIMLLDVSKHYKHGLEKYGERNWEKGIPLHSYIDSAIRHFIKWQSGWTDEPHNLAFVWNLMCCIHTETYMSDEDIMDLPFCKKSN